MAKGDKIERMSWDHPDTARRRAVHIRACREWLIVAATVYAAFGHCLHT